MSDKIVKLKDGGGYLYPISVLNGIDTSNLIYSSTGKGSNLNSGINISYTATQDCIFTLSYQARLGCNLQFIIDSVAFMEGTQPADVATTRVVNFPLKKNQVLNIKSSNYYASYYYAKVFGIKQY